jgi:Predicted Fe-S oxidoreductases
MKMQCIEVIKELDIPTVIVPTVSKGDNSGELGALVEFGLRACRIRIETRAVFEHRHSTDGPHG